MKPSKSINLKSRAAAKAASRREDRRRLENGESPEVIQRGSAMIEAEILLDRCQIRAVYDSAGADVPRERVLHPLALIQQGARSYLLATSDDHDGPIQYALHRFLSASALPDA
jgi:hypothetical protein